MSIQAVVLNQQDSQSATDQGCIENGQKAVFERFQANQVVIITQHGVSMMWQ
jgi:hypothetical protein